MIVVQQPKTSVIVVQYSSNGKFMLSPKRRNANTDRFSAEIDRTAESLD